MHRDARCPPEPGAGQHQRDTAQGLVPAHGDAQCIAVCRQHQADEPGRERAICPVEPSIAASREVDRQNGGSRHDGRVVGRCLTWIDSFAIVRASGAKGFDPTNDRADARRGGLVAHPLAWRCGHAAFEDHELRTRSLQRGRFGGRGQAAVADTQPIQQGLYSGAKAVAMAQDAASAYRQGRDQCDPLVLGKHGGGDGRAGDVRLGIRKDRHQPRIGEPHHRFAQQRRALRCGDERGEVLKALHGSLGHRSCRACLRALTQQIDQLPELDACDRRASGGQPHDSGKAIVEMHQGSARLASLIARTSLIPRDDLFGIASRSKDLAAAKRHGWAVAKRDDCARKQ